MQSSDKKMIPLLLTPLLYVNLAGMVAGAVWLGVLSQWNVIWIGIVSLFFSPYIIPILMMPAGILSHFMALHGKAGRKDRERLMLVFSLAYILLFLTLWCVGIFGYVTENVRPDALPAGLLWANAAALAPLLRWACRDRKNIFIMTLVEAAQAVLLVLSAVMLFYGRGSFWTPYVIFFGIMAFVIAVQAFFEEKSR